MAQTTAAQRKADIRQAAQVKLDAAMVEAVQWARYEPVKFAREILRLKRLPGELEPGAPGYSPDNDWSLDPWIEELLNAIADVARIQAHLPPLVNTAGKVNISVRSCRGPGKTFGLAVAAHTFGFAWDPCGIGVVAPKLEHIKSRFMGEFNKIAGRAIEGYRTLMTIDTQVVHWNVPDRVNHLLIAETARHPENIQGFRKRYTLYLQDEASGIADSIDTVVDGNLASTEIGIKVKVGNPTRNVGHFAHDFLAQSASPDVHRMHVTPAHSKRVKQSWIDRMTRRYGVRSPAVQIHCFGEFASADASQLIALEWIAKAKTHDGIDPIKGDGSLPRNRISVDCAAGGEDETVVTAMRHFEAYRVALKQTRHNFGLETASIDTAKAAEAMFKMFSFDKARDDIVVDANGTGAGAAGFLHAQGYRVVFHMGGERSDDPARWRNRRVQTHLCMRDDFRDGTIRILDSFYDDAGDWDDFDGQLCSIKMQSNGERVEDLQTKEEMKRQGLKSPDLAESLCMQYAQQVPQATTAAMLRQIGSVQTFPDLLVARSSINDGLNIPGV